MRKFERVQTFFSSLTKAAMPDVLGAAFIYVATAILSGEGLDANYCYTRAAQETKIVTVEVSNDERRNEALKREAIEAYRSLSANDKLILKSGSETYEFCRPPKSHQERRSIQTSTLVFSFYLKFQADNAENLFKSKLDELFEKAIANLPESVPQNLPPFISVKFDKPVFNTRLHVFGASNVHTTLHSLSEVSK